MAKLSYIKNSLLSLALLAGVSASAVAQNYYYDDDIYYNASTKKSEQKKQDKKQTQDARSNYVISGQSQTTNYPAADTYSVPPVPSRDIDVDAYNRRTPAAHDTTAMSSGYGNDFTYTRRIERFHNPDIVSGSGDQELIEVYDYAMQQPQNVNIYVINNDPWYDWYGSPSWSWRFGNPWYWNSYYPYPYYGWGYNSWAWDPYWSWGPSWGWGPSWSWTPAWGPSWGWTPGWGMAWVPSHAWRPVTPSGSSRPHNYVGSSSYTTHRPGSAASAANSRPGNMGRGRYGTSVQTGVAGAGSRPGSYTPSNSGSYNNSTVNNSRPGNSGRGRSSVNSNNSNNRSSYNNSGSNNRTPSYNSGGSFRSSGGSSRGSSGSHGSMSGGGGSSRGRR